jgi:hypothetical protein
MKNQSEVMVMKGQLILSPQIAMIWRMWKVDIHLYEVEQIHPM